MENKKTYKPYKKKETAPKAQYKPKRGKLAPLMSEEEKAKAGIHELSYDFACRITRLFQYLTEDADFLSKMSIAYKEADETDFYRENDESKSERKIVVKRRKRQKHYNPKVESLIKVKNEDLLGTISTKIAYFAV